MSARRLSREKSFYFEGGLVSFVRHLNKGRDVLHDRPIYVERREGTTQIEVALQYNDSYSESRLLVRQQHQHGRRRHARHRLPGRADQLAQRLRAQATRSSRTPTPTSQATTCAKA